MSPRCISCHRTRQRTLLVLATIIILLACVANAGERRHCVRAEIDENFMLPNGSVHPPGELKLCLIRSMSPVSGAHGTHVNGHSVGYFLSVKMKLAAPEQTASTEPYFEFVRNRRGELELRGYAWHDGSTLLDLGPCVPAVKGLLGVELHDPGGSRAVVPPTQDLERDSLGRGGRRQEER